MTRIRSVCKFKREIVQLNMEIQVTYCYRFTLQGLGSGGAVGVASVRSYEKLPPCLIKPVPASSKTDPPLAKAKPSSDDGSASGIADLRSGKKNTGVEQQSGERSEMM